jgi:glycosyltransferase involved in cell wall biosynthesis
MLTPYLPYPPSSGGQVRSYNLLKNLGKKHKIVLVSLIKSEQEKKFVKRLQRYCEKIYICKKSPSPWTLNNVLRSIFGLYPFLVVRNFSSEAKKLVFNLINKESFDLIHAETFYIMPHIPITNTPVLLVEQTIEYQVYQHFVNSLKYFFIKPFLYFDILKLKFWEKTYWQKADLVVTVSEIDKKKMLKLLPDLAIKIIPNGAGEDLMKIFNKNKIICKPIFLYQGNFAWLQNIEAAKILAESIFPKIKNKVPASVCYIAGQQAKNKIGYLKKYGVKIIDINPSNIRMVKKLYQRASIFLAPIKGPGGTRLKILGAMAAGIPVVSSKVGVEGLDLKHEKEVLIIENENDFVNHAIKLLNNQELYVKIRENARLLVEKKYNWFKIARELEQIYLNLQKDHVQTRL